MASDARPASLSEVGLHKAVSDHEVVRFALYAVGSGEVRMPWSKFEKANRIGTGATGRNSGNAPGDGADDFRSTGYCRK